MDKLNLEELQQNLVSKLEDRILNDGREVDRYLEEVEGEYFTSNLWRIEELIEEEENLDAEELKELEELKEVYEHNSDILLDFREMVKEILNADEIISDSYFEEYTREMIEDVFSSQIDALPDVLKSNFNWDHIINEVKHDYNYCEFYGFKYYYR